MFFSRCRSLPRPKHVVIEFYQRILINSKYSVHDENKENNIFDKNSNEGKAVACQSPKNC